ncbi:hypothetical protein PC121_g9529 [Phytophthora cactorum]|nr:hypothetical protein PC120_g12771 [Phytophthora cactorum]KAG3070381.1 hypothetical protein PC121_g9529 [Phytophthora cactorum]
MSDDDQSLSDDDGADLFESNPEDLGSEVENSLALPSLSLDSFYVRSPQQSEQHGLDEGTEYENTGCATDQSVGGGFGVGDAVSSPAKIEGEGQELDIHVDSPAEDDRDDPSQAELETCRASRSQDEVPNETEDVAVNQLPATIASCESPKLPGPNDHQQIDADPKPIEHDKLDNELNTAQVVHFDDDFTRYSDVDYNKTTPEMLEFTNKTRDTSTTFPDKAVHFEHNDVVSVPAESEELATELNPAKTSHNENTNEQNTPDKTSHESLQLQTDINPSDSTPLKTAAKLPMYTVESLFPVVYESRNSQAASEIAQVVPISSNTQKPTRRRRTQIDGSSHNPEKTIASRLAALHARLDAAKSDLANATRTFKLQLSMVETDNKKLSERNARLKTQLSLSTANLQRSNAEKAKLKTENEIYAAKLPRLQAELLEETSQVDETQAQSVQTQLILTQLKARSHVLQTRNHSLETQNNKLTQQLREYQQQLKRKTAALQQQTEKANTLEVDMNELKTTHTQEKLDWKNRLTTALQRFEYDKIKLETQFKAAERKEYRDVKDRAEKAVKKRRTAEATTAKLEEQLKQRKHELSSANDTVQRRTNEVRTLEALLRKAHRTEATLHNDLAVCKTKLRSLQDEKKRSMARPVSVLPRRQRLHHQVPIEMLLHLTDSIDDDEEEDNQDKQCCSHSLALSKDQSPPSVCSECPQLKDRLHQLQRELRRLRSLHATELHAQASVLEALLQRNIQ